MTKAELLKEELSKVLAVANNSDELIAELVKAVEEPGTISHAIFQAGVRYEDPTPCAMCGSPRSEHNKRHRFQGATESAGPRPKPAPTKVPADPVTKGGYR